VKYKIRFWIMKRKILIFDSPSLKTLHIQYYENNFSFWEILRLLRLIIQII